MKRSDIKVGTVYLKRSKLASSYGDNDSFPFVALDTDGYNKQYKSMAHSPGIRTIDGSGYGILGRALPATTTTTEFTKEAVADFIAKGDGIFIATNNVSELWEPHAAILKVQQAKQQLAKDERDKMKAANRIIYNELLSRAALLNITIDHQENNAVSFGKINVDIQILSDLLAGAAWPGLALARGSGSANRLERGPAAARAHRPARR